MSISVGKDTFIVCRNSQGTEVRATQLRLTRYMVVFEVYNPYSILQLSEVLNDFKIIINDRMVYSGRAVVSNLLNTGIILICEATLENEWLDVDIFTTMYQKEKLQSEFAEFLKEWQKTQHISAQFKAVIADLQTFLMDMQRWLEQVELGIQSEASHDRIQVERDAIHELEAPVFSTVGSLFMKYEDSAVGVPEDLQPIHRAYCKNQIHPLILCSPFVYRVFRKPLGYAGDYEMVNMMLRDPFEGSSLFAKILNVHFLKSPPCEAHRNRIKYLTEILSQETRRISHQGRDIRIFNLGCGPAREVQNFMGNDEICDKAHLTLMDFNDETLQYTESILNGIKERNHRKTSIKMVKKSVNQILKDSLRPVENLEEKNFDLVYCAGLFDYLSDRICKRLMDYFYDILAPDGLLIATNVDKSNPIRNGMEAFLEWHLVYRDRQQLMELKPTNAPEGACQVKADVTGVNIFIEVRKPGHGQ
jgi:extracellular factor (EF) 3-hydroxypalmitic acid methyl ester biosynthesis protein